MTRHIEATFEIASWDETPFEDSDENAKLTEALVTKKFTGDIDGTSTTKWLMAYAPDKTAMFVIVGARLAQTRKRETVRTGDPMANGS